jgi:hypothetical protein
MEEWLGVPEGYVVVATTCPRRSRETDVEVSNLALRMAVTARWVGRATAQQQSTIEHHTAKQRMRSDSHVPVCRRPSVRAALRAAHAVGPLTSMGTLALPGRKLVGVLGLKHDLGRKWACPSQKCRPFSLWTQLLCKTTRGPNE